MNLRILVTCPDATSAQATEQWALKEIKTTSPFSWITSTHDPYNSRCGSGGGTLAAMMMCVDEKKDEEEKEAHERVKNDDTDGFNGDTSDKVLNAKKYESNTNTFIIIHAGGESSRCPTQMVLGKAWTTLPCHDSNSSSSIQSPTSLLLSTLQTRLLPHLPEGSVVVAASDTLLQLPLDDIDWTVTLSSLPQDAGVIGVAVPAPWKIAQNHGVYVLPSLLESNPRIVPVSCVLQKPSYSDLVNFVGEESYAYIDTGIVIFLPAAASALTSLARNELKCCCWEGLRQLWKEEEKSNSMSLEDFARCRAVKVDLYTHFLMACMTRNGIKDDSCLNDYIKQHGDLPEDIAKAIYQSLSPFSLHALVIPQGHFLHLGTTQELLQFIVESTADGKESELTNQTDSFIRSRSFGKELNMIPEYESLLFSEGCLYEPKQAHSCFFNTLLHTSGKLSVGEGTLLEHVCIQHAKTNIEIGSGCLISGWRRDYAEVSSYSHIVIPDDTCLQIIPLLEDGKFVVMYLGVSDNIKGWNQVYGLDAAMVYDAMEVDNLWDANEEVKVLWTAKLHPVVSVVDLPSLFAWIHELKETGKIVTTSSSLNIFRSHNRLSLKQIRNYSDAQQEWKFRINLEKHILPLHIKLWKRQHQECNPKLEEITLKTLRDICRKSLMAEKYEICARGCMIASAIFADQSTLHEQRITLPDDMERILDDFRNSKVDRISSCLSLFDYCNDLFLLSSQVMIPSLILEKAASVLVELCVCGQQPRKHLPVDIPKAASHNLKWHVATAPARVDLSGGWSDTPPICLENGGAVAGIAVLVDGLRPLSCRSRIVPAGKGIRLVTESRDPKTGGLQDQTESYLHKTSDLDDYRNPLAACALIKCALIFLGLICSNPSDDLQPMLQSFCNVDYDIGMEIISTSLLPRGSGLGTSSILAGCILTSISNCVGINFGQDDEEKLVQAVLLLEQMLTSGGGWQDQIGGLVGGFKLGLSQAGRIPVAAAVERIDIPLETTVALNSRLVLVFTGQTRLAKNILQNVLRRWARRTPEIVETVIELVRYARNVAAAVSQGDLVTVADCLNHYWEQKKIMAGDDSGVEPPVVKFVLEEMLERKLIVAGSLCGAGGGGFMVLLLAKDRTIEDVREIFISEILPLQDDAKSFEWHTCTVSTKGITTLEASGSNDFDFQWHGLNEG